MWLREFFRQGRNRNRLWRGHDLMTKARFIRSQVEHCVPQGARHLDIACGSGEVLLVFEDLGCRSVGIELNEWRLARCRQGSLTVVRANMTATFPFGEETFDLITLISTIEHVPHPRGLLEEVNRVLSLDGVMVIQIPNPYFPIDLHYFLPFYGYLPRYVQRIYRRLLAGTGYSINYYTAQVTRADLEALFAGYTQVYAQDIVYPFSVVPNWLRPFYSLYRTSMLSELFPTGHLFVYRKYSGEEENAG